MLRIISFKADEDPGSYSSFETWQTKNPDKKIIETKMYTVEHAYTEAKIMVVYEEDK